MKSPWLNMRSSGRRGIYRKRISAPSGSKLLHPQTCQTCLIKIHQINNILVYSKLITREQIRRRARLIVHFGFLIFPGSLRLTLNERAAQQYIPWEIRPVLPIFPDGKLFPGRGCGERRMGFEVGIVSTTTRWRVDGGSLSPKESE